MQFKDLVEARPKPGYNDEYVQSYKGKDGKKVYEVSKKYKDIEFMETKSGDVALISKSYDSLASARDELYDMKVGPLKAIKGNGEV